MITPQSDYNFESSWKKIDSLERKGLYKSAIKIVDEIYMNADKDNIGVQKIKALFYKGKYTNYLQEDNLESFESILRMEITKSQFPDKEIFQSILAEFYDKYLNANSWQIKKRTEISDTTNEDIQTWTAGRFIKESNDLYNSSISNFKLKEVSYKMYGDIFTSATNTEKMRDNLYEILVFRALDHFKNDRNYLPKTTQSFKVDNSEYLSTPAVFADIQLKSSDKNDAKYKTLVLFQELEKHNLKTKDYEELLDITLKRLDFVKGQYLKQDKDELYLNTIDQLIEKYPSTKTISEVYYKKAILFKTLGEKLKAVHAPEMKWKIKEARDICIKVQDKYQETLGSSLCKQLKHQIEKRQLTIDAEKVNLPNENILVRIGYKNIDNVYFRLLKISSEQYKAFNEIRNDKVDFLHKLDTYKEWSTNLPNDGDYRIHSVEVGIEQLVKGTYILLSSNNKNFTESGGVLAYQFLHVSNLAYWTKSDRSGNFIFVVNRKTGVAISNANVTLSYMEWDRRYRKRKEIQFLNEKTNSQGYIKYKSSDRHRNYSIIVTKNDDILNIDENIYSNRIYSSKGNDHITFFTDRAIYRPGQTLYYKGLYLHKDKDGMPSIIRNKNGIKLEFKDANWQKISETTVSTNEFGSFNGSFTIPTSGLTGNMTIQERSTGSSISFKVEEYKRPKFEVKFEDYKSSYKLGDKIDLTGVATTYSGFPLQDAKVIFTVKRIVYYPYYWGDYFRRPQGGSVEISHGETTTDAKGDFVVPVDLFVEDINLDTGNPNFAFEIKADVVDITGETHSSKKSLNAGVTDVNITMKVDNIFKNDKDIKISITSTNHNGQKVDTKGSFIVSKLIEPKKVFRSRLWAKPDTFIYSKEEFYDRFPSYTYKNDGDKHFWKIEKEVKSVNFKTKENEGYSMNLPVGEYKIVLNFDDPSGKKIKIEKYISVYSEEKNPYNSLLLVETDKDKYNPDTGAKIQWFSAIKNLNVYYTLWKRNRYQFGKNWLNLNKKDDLTIKILEEHRGGVVVLNTYVYNNRFYQDEKRISIPWSNKQLSFEYLSFRSKLYPGQDEEWRIKIKGNESEKVFGEILAGMYDASLDNIIKRDWQKNIYYPTVDYIQARSFGFNTSHVRYLYGRDWREYGYGDYRKEYRKLNWFGFHVQSNFGGGVMYNDTNVMMRSAVKPKSMRNKMSEGASPMAEMSEVMVEESMSYDTELKQDSSNDKNTEKVIESEDIQLRTNLNETVFFYPDLITDKDGNFILKFKMNDALTKWKLRMFAHTKDLSFAYEEKEIITQKELMITPNNPRFVREGDKLTFKARIDNLTENTLSGSAWVELYDAESMQPLETVLLKAKKDIDFSMGSKGSALVSWEMEFPKNKSNLLIYRFYAKAGDYSDAEEGVLPVLTNQKLVTETMPLWVKGKETKNFTFKSLKNSKGKDIKNINFTIEATSRPIWLAIQSLPYLKDVTCENSISYTNALFSNLLAKKITDDNPKIKRVFEKWKNSNTKIDKEAMLSNLSKNQELKNILLEETPWVLDAINEEQQKRNIALLFDLNQVKNDKNIFVRKLKGLQNSDGGFPWFKHGKSSRYITQYIIETFGRMQHLGLLKEERIIKAIINEAIEYVNRDVVEDYKKLLELAKKGKVDLDKNHLGSLMIHYMYAIQFYPNIKMNKDLQQAYNYYFGQAKKYWLDRPLYLKGILALVLYRGEETSIAKEVLRAAEEQSIVSEELGMYWKSYHGYHWWQLPIETQALMIEAFDEVNNDMEIVSQLKIWLLKNKQTNRWKTDKATVSAIYSLLFDQGGTIEETGLVNIYVAGKDIVKDLPKNDIQAGTGYYKRKWSSDEIKSTMSEIKIENPNKDIAWGTVYWQYLQDLDKIETFEDTPLKIKRILYLVKNTNKGEVMTEIKQGDILNPGDLIKVKIRLQVDREMEFVHLADQRAATFEPLQQLSGYHWQGGLGYYQNPRDTKMNFFIDYLPRGVFVLEYSLRATQSGIFSNGIAELQSYYAPEFSSHSEGIKIEVK